MEDGNKKILNLKALKPQESVEETAILGGETQQKDDSIEENTSLHQEIPIASGDILVIGEEVTEEIKIPHITKISLSTLQGEENPKIEGEEKSAEKQAKSQKEEELSEKKEGFEEIQKEIPKEEIIEEKPQKKMLVLQKMFGKNPEPEVEKTAEEIQEEEKLKLKKEEERLEQEKTKVNFQNYESGFQKKSNNVLKRIQNFKYTPKTRGGLLIGLIVICFLFISSLMTFFPEKHSISLYKASILDITGLKKTQLVEIPEDTNIGVDLTIPDMPPIDEKGEQIPEEITGDILENETGLDTQIQEEEANKNNSGEESKPTRKEILRQHLIERYGK